MPKLLIVGPLKANSHKETVVRKLRDLHASKHGPFEGVLVVGLSNERRAELVARLNGDDDGEEGRRKPLKLINPVFRGRRDRAKYVRVTRDGLTYGFLMEPDGSLATNKRKEEEEDDDEGLDDYEESNNGESSKPVDVLVSNFPPLHFNAGLAREQRGVVDESGLEVIDDEFNCSRLCATLADRVHPRYHFTGNVKSETFHQRLPYVNAAVPTLTRLITLAPAPEESAAGVKSTPFTKWIHALDIPVEVASSKKPIPAPGTVSPNPYTYRPTTTAQPPPALDSNSSTRNRGPSSSSSSASFSHHDKSNKRQRTTTTTAPQNRLKRSPIVPPRMDCWFCLANPQVEQHLVATIGEETYVALPKGGMAKEHALVVPISHEPCLAFLDVSSLEEIADFQERLSKHFATRGFALIATERSLVLGKAAQRHCYLELLPVPVGEIAKAQEAMEIEAKIQGGVEFKPLSSGPGTAKQNLLSLKRLIEGEEDEAEVGDNEEATAAKEEERRIKKENAEYIYISLPGGRAYVHRVQGKAEKLGIRAPLHFGRSVACRLMNAPDKVQWKACVKSKQEETAWADELKRYFVEISASQ